MTDRTPPPEVVERVAKATALFENTPDALAERAELWERNHRGFCNSYRFETERVLACLTDADLRALAKVHGLVVMPRERLAVLEKYAGAFLVENEPTEEDAEVLRATAQAAPHSPLPAEPQEDGDG